MSVPSSGNAPRPAPAAHFPTTAISTADVVTAGSATTAAAVPPGGRRQKRMGPAPFASFEDLSDELESPEDKNAAGSLVRLPGIREDVTPTPSNTPAAPIGTDQQRTSEFTYPIGISLVGACAAPASSSPSTTIMSSQSSTRSRLQTPSTPRIDISRASSSSHHDSRDSTPERELFEGHSAANATTKLGLAFREEGALDLRSSTEELDFQDQQQQVDNKKGNKAGKNRAQSPSLCLHDDPHYQPRKDSQSSEIGLLSISGRTSRLSSIGSQGSGQSRLSNASHLSVISGQSGLSRSPSPHKMLLETSFIGTKPPVSSAKQVAAVATGAEEPQEEEEGTKVESEAVLEKVLLSRKSDPTEAVLAEGISLVQRVDSNRGFDANRERHPHTNQVGDKPATTAAAYVKKLDNRVQNVKSDITIKVDEPSSSSSSSVTTTTSNNNSTTSAKIPKTIVSKSGVEYIYIPLKGPLPVDDSSAGTASSSTAIVRTREVKSASSATQPGRSSASTSKDKQTSGRPRVKSANLSPVPSQRKAEADEPKYIRIKLKPDYMYSSKQGSMAGTTQNPEKQKPDTLDLSSSNNNNNNNKEPDKKPVNLTETVVHRDEIIRPAEPPSKVPPLHHQHPQQQQDQAGISLSNTPTASPKFSKHNFLKDSGNVGSKTPSPSLSRKSSFASLFRSKETIISPESPTVPGCRRKNTITGILRDASDSLRDRSRSRSKSRERDKTSSNLSAAPSSTESIDSKTKQKSVFSIFKPKKGDNKTKTDTDTTSSSEVLPSIEGIAKVEFKFNETTSTSTSTKPDLLKYFEKPLEGDSIRIPLHSPTHYDDHGILQDLKTSSQDSQETVIEVSTTRNFETVVEVTTAPPLQAVAATTTMETKANREHNYRQDSTKRQSSTSSENVVFSTKLGNNNGVFTTKLPKDKDNKNKDKPALKLVRSSEIRTIDASGQEEIVIETEPTKNTNAPETTVVLATVETTNHTKVIRTESSCSVKSDKQKLVVDNSTSTKPTTSSCASVKKYTESSSVSINTKHSVEEKPTGIVESVIPVTKSSMDESATTTAAAVKSKKPDKNLPDLPATNRTSTISSTADDERYYSSESERDSEIEFIRDKKDLDLKLDLDYGAEPERKGLVLQQDSYEDELPYIPTTLPQEKSAAVPIVPVKQRSTFEMKTYPIERPRSTTPINPSCLEEYCEEVMGVFNSENVTKTIEKLKICLPKNHDAPDKSCKSPRSKASTATTNTTNWFEFAEKGISSGRRSSLSQGQQENDTPGPPPPPLPPKGIQKEWINFEEIPERRKPPKRIQTLPSRGYIDVPDSILQDNIVYNYVNPEECKCECHEITSRERERRERVEIEAVTAVASTEGRQEVGVGVVEEGGGDGGGGGGAVQEDELPLLEDEPAEAEEKSGRELIDRIKLDVGISDRRSVISDSSVDLSTCVEPPEANGVDSSLKTPFTSDLGVSSNRSSIVSQDEPQSPDSGSPNAFPKTF